LHAHLFNRVKHGARFRALRTELCMLAAIMVRER
jgi:hypothetical protein